MRRASSCSGVGTCTIRTTRHPHRAPQRLLCAQTNTLDQPQQPNIVATVELVPREAILVRAVHRHQPAALAQFERNENRAIMTRDGRAYVGCSHLTSPMVRVVANPNLSEARPSPHGIYGGCCSFSTSTAAAWASLASGMPQYSAS